MALARSAVIPSRAFEAMLYSYSITMIFSNCSPVSNLPRIKRLFFPLFETKLNRMSKAISYMLAFLTAGILLSCNENKYTEEDVESADGLEVLTDDFAKDSLQAYYHKLPIPGSDPATFVALDKAYAKDKDNVYFCFDDSYLNHWPFTW